METLQNKVWVFGAPFSSVLQVKYITATFNTEMTFVDFPFDSQILSMKFRTAWDVNMLGMGVDSVVMGNNKAPGWAVKSITNEPGYEMGSETYNIRSDLHPFKPYFAEGGSNYTAATMTIHVERERCVIIYAPVLTSLSMRQC
jgi:hypothetical protein